MASRANGADNCILTLSCKNRIGIVAAVSTFLAERGGDIVEAQQFDDAETGLFFMRIEFSGGEAALPQSSLESEFAAVAEDFGMDWNLVPSGHRKKVALLVSRFDHCLAELLYRTRIGELKMDVVGIISNHRREALSLAPLGDIPFHHLPTTPETRPQQEEKVRNIIAETKAELVVLARYMQILSDRLSSELEGRCVNIHHSFLPGFKGARPYHQAHRRGVKLIGATAHFVTPELDEGPIIAQDVVPVTHADSPERLIRKGREVEQRVLAQAVGLILEERVFINGSKTVVFGA